ncbi:hypothetical protein Sjap_025604 [Stephania japonica]|uniref:Disease resistance R13L4/SHOC-2-like LRR domain-containing protein n=2 Tax=Magnoliopsida TaxID=3398 RepID=A0AAP0E9S2_9MAGN
MDRILKAARASGSLNLSNRSLREVPKEVYGILETVGNDENWWEAVELQKLILAHNSIEVLKEDIKNLSFLSVLNISHNKLSQLPSSIGELHTLKSLDVSHNSMVNVPEEIGSLSSLVKFDCSNNQLREIPISLGRCLNLSDLKASNNFITKLPKELENCSKLMKLDVEGNKLTILCDNNMVSWTMLTELNASKNLLASIPGNIGVLSRLIRLDFHQNRVSSIPPSIAGCSSLAEFYMGNNLLSLLPAEIGALSQLGTFDLHSNQLKEYPVEACKLRLSVLDLSNNSLSGLPPEIGNMTTLRKLLLAGNPLRTLRSSLVSGPAPALLKYLRSRLSTDGECESAASPIKEDHISMAVRSSLLSKELRLSGLGLSHVPSTVWESGEILKVDLSKNLIEMLPHELSSCTSLQDVVLKWTLPSRTMRLLCVQSAGGTALILSGNRIREWPSSVLRSLHDLLHLKMDSNHLGQIPTDGFEALSKLQILDLSGNSGSLPKPGSISCLQQLQELYLRRMQLHEVPADVLSLPKLQILDLGQNSIVSIPEELGNLSSLTELDLTDNNITTLPPKLGLLEPSLQALRLDGNPLRSIRRVILDRGTKAILNYLKEKIPEP